MFSQQMLSVSKMFTFFHRTKPRDNKSLEPRRGITFPHNSLPPPLQRQRGKLWVNRKTNMSVHALLICWALVFVNPLCRNVYKTTNLPRNELPLSSGMEDDFPSFWRYSISAKIRIVFLMGQPRPLFRIFSGLFKQTIQFLQPINVKNVMSIQYTAQTHNLSNMSHLH